MSNKHPLIQSVLDGEHNASARQSRKSVRRMQDKELVIEVRVKWDDFMNNDELQMIAMFRERAQNAIKRKVVDEIVARIVNELPTPEIDLSDLKEQVKNRIVDRKVDEILD